MKRPLLISAALFLLLLSAGVVRMRTDERNWERVAERADRWQREIDAIDRRRPVLWGEVREGQAWPHYDRAAGLIPSRTRKELAQWFQLLAPDSDGNPAAVALITTHRPVLDEIRIGAHCALGGDPVDWGSGWSVRTCNLQSSRSVVRLHLAQARIEIAQGNTLEAVHLWLDALQYGRDLAGSPIAITRMVGYAVVDVILQELQDLEPWSDLAVVELALLKTGLDELDPLAGLVPFRMENETILLIRAVQEKPGYDPSLFTRDLELWRYGWSFSMLMEEYTAEIERAGMELRSLEEKPIAEYVAAAQRISNRMSEHKNRMLHDMNGSLCSAMAQFRERTLTRLRSLRADLNR